MDIFFPNGAKLRELKKTEASHHHCRCRWPDPFIAHAGGETLYRNLGNGTFTDVTADSDLSTKPMRALGVCAARFDDANDGRLPPTANAAGEEAWKCDVFIATTPSCYLLFLNRVNGTFREMGPFWALPLSRGIGGGAQHNTLLENVEGQRFSDVSLHMGTGFLRTGCQRGSAFADLNNDCLPDNVVTSRVHFGTGKKSTASPRSR